MNSSHSLVIAITYFPAAMALNLRSSLCLDEIHVGGCLTHCNNSNRYYGINEGKIVLEEPHELWKHHAKHLGKLHQRNEHKDQQINIE